LAIYQHAAASHPDNATVLNDLGLCFARAGQMDQSLQALHAATKVSPTNPLFRNNIAKVLVEVNQLDNALAELSVVHAPATANYNLAVLLSEAGRPQEAAHFASVALQIDPQIQPARMLLAALNPSAAPATYGAPSYGAPYVASATAATSSVAMRPTSAGTPAVPDVQLSNTTGYSPWPTPGSASAMKPAVPTPPFNPASQPWPDAANAEVPLTGAGAPTSAGPEPTVLPPVG
jgi:Tfp pilus assembly protein PilF